MIATFLRGIHLTNIKFRDILTISNYNIYKMKVAEIKRNKIIVIENKVKLRYVNCTWGIEYAYEKYHTTSSMQLEMMWKEYVRIREEEERNRKNERQQEVYRSTIIRELRRYGVVDAGIWVLQPQALLDPKEMVEVRHSLNVRRQKLREHIDYNSKLWKHQLFFPKKCSKEKI